MSQNIETKAKLNDIKKTENNLQISGAVFKSDLVQEDIYFNIYGDKRLKLRTINNEKFVLISYERPNTDSEKIIKYLNYLHLPLE